MDIERYRILAGVIAAHPQRQVVGRTRLQKTVKLLQRLGLPTDYSYSIHYYGPYSEGVQAEIGLLEQSGWISESQKMSSDGHPYYVLTASRDSALEEIKQFDSSIQVMAQADATVLELAATYDAYREMGLDHPAASTLLRAKKGSKCEKGNEKRALQLLGTLGLSNG